ncbi:MAG: sensor histidine kinase [Bdellovibrionales bacterium]|nr:sensor histidine kinase [Bdellovibrionales bacterium]
MKVSATNIGAQFKKKMATQVSKMILSSMETTAFLSLGLLASILFVTPLFRKAPEVTVGFAGFVLAQVVLTFVLTSDWSDRLSDKLKSILFWANVVLPALAWGGFSSWVIYEFLISWSTFYITLLSCVVAVISIPVVYPRLEVLSGALVAQFLPPVVTCFLFLNGQQGMAFGLFFLAFGVLLFRVGLHQNRTFWENLKNTNKIEAVVDALPGAIVWLNSENKLSGANQTFQSNFLSESNELPSEIAALSKKIFEGGTPIKEVKLGRRTSLMTGRVFNEGTEAVIMGIDVSGQDVFEDQLEKSRQQLIENVSQFQLGTVFRALTDEGSQNFSREEWIEFQQIFSEEEMPVTVVVTWAKRLAQNSVAVDVEVVETIEIDDLTLMTKRPDLLFLALFEVLKNSLEAFQGQDTDSAKVTVNLLRHEDHFELLVDDNGKGFDEAYEDLIFQPFISDKEGHLGMGLSLAAEKIETIGEVNLLRNGPDGVSVQLKVS